MTQANETAFPFQPTNDDYSNNYGLTKREYFAAMAMQGMLANNWIEYAKNDLDCKLLTNTAINYADELLTQLSKNKTP